jgi:hypothetical protein
MSKGGIDGEDDGRASRGVRRLPRSPMFYASVRALMESFGSNREPTGSARRGASGIGTALTGELASGINPAECDGQDSQDATAGAVRANQGYPTVGDQQFVKTLLDPVDLEGLFDTAQFLDGQSSGQYCRCYITRPTPRRQSCAIGQSRPLPLSLLSARAPRSASRGRPSPTRFMPGSQSLIDSTELLMRAFTSPCRTGGCSAWPYHQPG